MAIYQIGQSSDDGQQAPGGNPTLTTDRVKLDVSNWEAGLRFTGINIGAGVTVREAYLQLYLYDIGEANFSNKYAYCESANNPGTFTTAINNITGRSKTTAVVALGTGQQTTSAWVNTPSLVTLVQEVINNNGGIGGSLVFIIKTTTTENLDWLAWDWIPLGTMGARLVLAAGEVYPTETITRVTNIIHRYNRANQTYGMELSLGEVTSDFGLPEWLARPQVAAPPKADEPATKKDVEGYTGIEWPEWPKPLEFEEWKPEEVPIVSEKVTAPFAGWPGPEKPSLWSRLTPWKEEKGETFGSALGELWKSITTPKKRKMWPWSK